ncbi:MAG: hypothetical protein HY043_10195 [Verrucomicrobia bacterium]|nr:hypothetical protein [Verrucomicrobiota bacterium]
MLKNPSSQRLRPPPSAPGEAPIPMGIVLAIMFLHMFLGVLMKKVPGVSTWHAFGSLVVGVIVACRCRRPITVAYVAAYVSGIEVIWRMTKAKVFTEWGKLIISIFVIIAVVRFSRAKRTWLPIVYFVLLIPACLIIIPELPYEDLHEAIPYTMSGPFALMACMCYFSGVKITPTDCLRVLLGVLIPIIALSAIVAFTTLTAADFDFSVNVRNVKDLSLTGGFGPNQVSSTLGLGVLAAFLIVMHERTPAAYKPVFFAITAGLATQAAMTFSRTGLYLAGGAIVTACFFYFGDPKMRPRILLFSIAMALAVVIILPILDNYTSGALMDRFKSFDTTGRDSILLADIMAFLSQPAFGLGVDQGRIFRNAYYGTLMESHVEWSRLMAEHGVFGLAALLILIYLGLRNFAAAQTLRARAIVASFIVFTFLYTSSCGMRLALASFIYGLACATFQFGPPRRRPRPPAPRTAMFSASPQVTVLPTGMPGVSR